MKPSVLMAWIGDADIMAANGQFHNRLGPIGQALRERTFSHAFLLSSRQEGEISKYYAWLKNQFADTVIKKYQAKLTSPTDFGEIYENARSAIAELGEDFRAQGISSFSLTYHLSPGTPIMAAVWIFLAKTNYPAELIESSVPTRGVQTVSFPFEIVVDYSPDLVRKQKGNDAISAPPEFGDIIYKCNTMKALINKAHKVAPYEDIHVLILGESGTGKELFARAIHNDSPRKEGPFVAVDCSAISTYLLESELFGHEKGAFTGATRLKLGYFEQAQGGTVFLDEIGEMAKDLQVKLLRAIEEKKIRRVGGDKVIRLDVRLIAATNRNISQEVLDGKFREDLYYRIAGEILTLPPLNERKEDIPDLIDHFLRRKNEEYKGKPGWKSKKLSAVAKNILYDHNWPGNVRELRNTLVRSALSAQGEIIHEKDIQQSMLLKIRKERDDENILNRNLGVEFNLESLLNEVAIHYIKRALDQVDGTGKKKKAAELLGFKSHQTFSNWLKRLYIDDH